MSVSTLGYALLGLLGRESLSGYELTSRMKQRVAFFWSTSHSQIYPELSALEEEKLVTHRVIEQTGRPDKKVYSATEDGMEALKAWVVSPPKPYPTRDELVLRAYCIWAADRSKAVQLFREHERLQEERLLDFERRKDWMEKEWGDDITRTDSPNFASYAALRRGIIGARGYAEWCRWVADCLETDTGVERDPGL